jgi:hypothetical protein
LSLLILTRIKILIKFQIKLNFTTNSPHKSYKNLIILPNQSTPSTHLHKIIKINILNIKIKIFPCIATFKLLFKIQEIELILKILNKYLFIHHIKLLKLVINQILIIFLLNHLCHLIIVIKLLINYHQYIELLVIIKQLIR